MKHKLPFLLAVVLVAALPWVARKPAQQPPLAGASASTTPAVQPRIGDSAREMAIAAVDAAAAADRRRQIALEVESALVSHDAGRRETALTVLLPELLGGDPVRVVELVARQPLGETRDALRDEVARQWIARDSEAAILWLLSLGPERGDSARVAVRTLAAVSPAQAIDAADRLDVGRDDGSIEHIVQMWAAESPREARRWLENQPDSPRIAQLRARLPL